MMTFYQAEKRNGHSSFRHEAQAVDPSICSFFTDPTRAPPIVEQVDIKALVIAEEQVCAGCGQEPPKVYQHR